MSRRSLRSRVEPAAEKILARQKYVSPVDVCVGLGWVQERGLDSWRQGRAASLEALLPVRDDQLTALLDCVREWATAQGLQPSEAEYVAATRDRRALRFTQRDDEAAERAWRVHWVSPGLTAAQQDRIAKKQSAPPDLVVFDTLKDFTCAECGCSSANGAGGLLFLEDDRPLCLGCADMDHLVFLAAGDATLTRRAKKASRLSAVVVRWSKSRKRYERQGLLVEEAALAVAEEQCLSDADVRARRRERDAALRPLQDARFAERFAAEITRLFPGCPPRRAAAIAGHAGVRGSGRVGRSAAGRALDESAVRLAVIASVRHLDTDYDDLLMAGVPRMEAREQIRPAIDRILAQWS